MHPATHALIGWTVANFAPSLERRERAIIFWASVLPDLDGLTLLGGAEMFQTWHRKLCHNALFAVVAIGGAMLLARSRRGVVALLFALNFHVHLLCDYLGSAGPDGSIWGIPYLQPFSPWELDNPHQWQLASWQNAVATVLALLAAAWIARRHGRTPLEPITLRGDAVVMEVVRRRMGAPGAPAGVDVPSPKP